GSQPAPEVGYSFAVPSEDSLRFIVENPADALGLAGSYHLHLGGDFNKGNGLSAAIASGLVGASKEECQQEIGATTVPVLM
ncbi:UDP-N-acetylmuramoyl-L-alanyl-D-glutamate--L-lysine ligase, partial [Enterococcus faecalis]